MNCCLCDNEFVLPKSKKRRDELYFRTLPKSNKKEYLCSECFHIRITSEFRIIDGDIMCGNRTCVRNTMAFSIYCDVCETKYL